MGNKMNIEEFIKECNQSPLFKRFNISITKEVLKAAEIKPDREGEYRRAQFLDLSKKLVGEDLLSSIAAHAIFQGEDDPVIRINTIFKESASMNKEIQSILFLILRPDFKEEIINFRKKWGISPAGFSTLNEMKRFFDAVAVKLERILKKYKIDLTEELEKKNRRIQSVEKTQIIRGKEKKMKPRILKTRDLARGFVSGLIFNDVSRIMDRFRTERYDSVGDCLLQYCFFLRDPLSLEDLKNSINRIATDELSSDRGMAAILAGKNRFEIHLLIDGATTQDDAIRAIKRTWWSVRRWQKKLSSSEKPVKKARKLEDIYRDYLVFYYHQKKLTYEDIAGQLLTHNYKINSALVKKIVERMKKRIKNA